MDRKSTSKESIINKGTLGETVLFQKNISLYFEKFYFQGVVITFSQLLFLNFLYKEEEVTYYSLSKRLPFNSKYILKMIKELEGKGAITRERRGSKKIISKTSFGRRLVIAVNKEREEFFQMFNNNGITWDELVVFYSTMERMNKVLKDNL